MKRALLAVAALALCLASAAGGYWLGFRDSWYLSQAAGAVPRGVVAVHQLRYLREGSPRPVIAALEFDVDKGLSYGEDVFAHPLRGLLGPLWGLGVYPGYEGYIRQMAAYRREHASLLEPQAFDRNQDLLQDARETKEKIDRMVQRYSKAAP